MFNIFGLGLAQILRVDMGMCPVRMKGGLVVSSTAGACFCTIPYSQHGEEMYPLWSASISKGATACQRAFNGCIKEHVC